MTYTTEKLNIVNEKLESASKIVIVAHQSPDGDSIGSSLALFHYLKLLGRDVVICHPDPSPEFLSWLDGASTILNFEHHKEMVAKHLEDAGIIFCLDFNAIHRVGKEMAIHLKESNAFKIVIDHHLNPADEFDIVFSEVTACSTAQLIFDFIQKRGDENKINQAIGEAIYCGIMTDSGSFRFPNTSAHTHEVLAKLLKAGVQHYKVHENVYDTNTIERLKLRGYAINEKLELITNCNAAIMSLTEEELERFNYQHGDTEGLVNVGLSILGIDKSIFLKQSKGIIKISFRSKGSDNPVNSLADNYFNGGGHANAAGGKWEGTMDEAIKKLKNVLPEFC